MRYVILRDDDTNAFTPANYLEYLYRPFLDYGLPVNLSVIPSVRSDLILPDGRPEGFLTAKEGDAPPLVPIEYNPELVSYLKINAGYHIVQHGCHHDPCEFDRENRDDVIHRLDQGTTDLKNAGFATPRTFVAPHDRFSRISFDESAKRFAVLSTGWFELRRLPVAWWPRFVWKKLTGEPHWRVGNTILLSHPGCLLSYRRPYDTMLDNIKASIHSQKLTVLVTHWWEYFRNNEPDDNFIEVLHKTAAYLVGNSGIRVITFDDLWKTDFPLS
ncbi:MAG: DUF2334 domain-containing protein [Verrucomicrobiota bacterium]